MAKKIDKILEEYAVAELKSKDSLENHAPGVRSGHAMLIDAAKQALPNLRAEIVAVTVPSRLIGAFIEGDPSRMTEVADFLRANRGIVLDAGSVWEEIADRVEPSFGDDRCFKVTQHNLMIQTYSHLARDAGFNQVETPVYVEGQCRTRVELVAFIRSRIRSVIGDELLLRVLKDRIVQSVVSNNLDDRRVPVMVTAAAAEERPALTGLFLRTNSIDLSSDFVATKDTVTALFKNPTQSATT